MSNKILIIGATGHFGERIAKRLSGEPNTELIVSSRSLQKSFRLAKTLSQINNSYPVSAIAIDYLSDTFEIELEAVDPDIVIHTAGPYQGQSYRVANACIKLGSHYIDLADGREFVDGFHELNKAATNAGVLAVSGVSTLPGISTAVINEYRNEFAQINSIRMSIAPAHQTPRGISTISAVLSYCGKPFSVLENGTQVTKYGWQDLTWQAYPKLGKRLSGVCDVPDNALLIDYIPGVKTVTFHASLEAKWEQAGLWCMAWLSRVGLVRSWNKAIPLFNFISERFIKLGTDVGGMHLELIGTDTVGNIKSMTWFLHAQNNHGPEIPCTPAVILTRKLARNEIQQRGAMPCLGLFTLNDFDHEICNFDVDWELVR